MRWLLAATIALGACTSPAKAPECRWEHFGTPPGVGRDLAYAGSNTDQSTIIYTSKDGYATFRWTCPE